MLVRCVCGGGSTGSSVWVALVMALGDGGGWGCCCCCAAAAAATGCRCRCWLAGWLTGWRCGAARLLLLSYLAGCWQSRRQDVVAATRECCTRHPNPVPHPTRPHPASTPPLFLRPFLFLSPAAMFHYDILDVKLRPLLTEGLEGVGALDPAELQQLLALGVQVPGMDLALHPLMQLAPGLADGAADGAGMLEGLGQGQEEALSPAGSMEEQELSGSSSGDDGGDSSIGAAPLLTAAAGMVGRGAAEQQQQPGEVTASMGAAAPIAQLSAEHVAAAPGVVVDQVSAPLLMAPGLAVPQPEPGAPLLPGPLTRAGLLHQPPVAQSSAGMAGAQPRWGWGPEGSRSRPGHAG